MRIAFTGLVSAGKSSVIISIILKRANHTGVSRTTLVNNIIKHDAYDLIDLPGINDTFEASFDKLTKDTIVDCDLIVWCSDCHSAFINKHEWIEFKKIVDYVNTLYNGRGYQFLILLTKFNYEFINTNVNIKRSTITNDSEIIGEETSSVYTNYENLMKLLNDNKMEYIDVLPYNAHGRSFHHANTSLVLKDFIKTNPTNFNTNIEFATYVRQMPIAEEKSILQLIFREMYCYGYNINGNYQICINCTNCIHNLNVANTICTACLQYKYHRCIHGVMIHKSVLNNNLNTINDLITKLKSISSIQKIYNSLMCLDDSSIKLFVSTGHYNCSWFNYLSQNIKFIHIKNIKNIKVIESTNPDQILRSINIIGNDNTIINKQYYNLTAYNFNKQYIYPHIIIEGKTPKGNVLNSKLMADTNLAQSISFINQVSNYRKDLYGDEPDTDIRQLILLQVIYAKSINDYTINLFKL
jgi:hypothetical protein